MTQRILQQLKMRDAVRIQRDELAVDDRVALYALERFRDFHVALSDDLAVAVIERDLAPSRISATILKPSYLSSNTQPAPSKGASVSFASICCSGFARVEMCA